MANNIPVNKGGIWTATKPQANKGGVWTASKEGWANKGGVWTKSYSAIALGGTVTMGGHNWFVVNVDAAAHQAILVCTDDLGTMAFNTATHAYWNYPATLRTYLNGTFYNSFTASEKAQILTRHNPFWDLSRVSYTDDNVWVPSLGEVITRITRGDGTLFGWLGTNNTDAARQALFGGRNVWTRTAYDASHAFAVSASGDFASQSTTNTIGYAPCIMISI